MRTGHKQIPPPPLRGQALGLALVRDDIIYSDRDFEQLLRQRARETLIAVIPTLRSTDTVAAHLRRLRSGVCSGIELAELNGIWNSDRDRHQKGERHGRSH
jgi:hypothetical protein